jgi:ABC-type antimicrobial peptide transport system permease subunit
MACGSSTVLLLARSARQELNLAVRAALGASPAQLAIKAAYQGMTLAALGGVGGLAFAHVVLWTIRGTLPVEVPWRQSIVLDGRILIIGIGMVMCVGLIASVAPAIRASRQNGLILFMERSARAGNIPAIRHWLARVLSVQVALVAALLVLSSSVIADFAKTTLVDLGFDRDHLILSGVAGPRADMSSTAIMESVKSIPGVVDVGLAFGGAPLTNPSARVNVRTADGTTFSGDAGAAVLRVTPSYFSTIGIRLRRGRLLDASDVSSVPPAAVLSEAAAARYFGRREAIGEALTSGIGGLRSVIGVVADVKGDDLSALPIPTIYLPMAQLPRGSTFTVAVRTLGSPELLAPALQNMLKQHLRTDASSPSLEVPSDKFRSLTADRRSGAVVMSILGIVALAIGASTIYAVVNFVTGQQIRDVAVRLALGSSLRRETWKVTAFVWRYLGLGLLVGSCGAWAIARLYGQVFNYDLILTVESYAVVSILLASVGTSAVLISASRLMRFDPALILRHL